MRYTKAQCDEWIAKYTAIYKQAKKESIRELAKQRILFYRKARDEKRI